MKPCMTGCRPCWLCQLQGLPEHGIADISLGSCRSSSFFTACCRGFEEFCTGATMWMAGVPPMHHVHGSILNVV